MSGAVGRVVAVEFCLVRIQGWLSAKGVRYRLEETEQDNLCMIQLKCNDRKGRKETTYS